MNRECNEGLFSFGDFNMDSGRSIMKINLTALKWNLKMFRDSLKEGTKLMVMLKAFAYGTGPVQIARWLEKQALVDYLAVAHGSEGVDLRREGQVSLPIMIMSVTEHEFELCHRFNLEPVIYSLYLLDKLINWMETSGSLTFPSIHIKVDTGLHRLGINVDEVPSFIDKMKSYPNHLHIKSIFSHFIGSYSCEIDSITRDQARSFIVHSELIEKSLGYSLVKHLCNSGGIVRHPEFQLDMVRLGVGLFGLWPIGSKKDFQKIVVSLFAPILHLQYVQENGTVGYNQQRLRRHSLIGTLRIGYADGLKRHLNDGQGRAWAYGHEIPILSLSMDTTIVDLTDLDGMVKINDQVEIFGEHIPIERMAQWCQMASYEFILGFSSRIRRIHIEETDE